jgi:hypothetical protein
MANTKNILQAALDYQARGFSVIPTGADKKPLISWKEFQERRATPEEIKGWLEQYPAMNIAIVTGKISGIVVVDLEKGANSEGYPVTVTAKTGGDGIHLYYKHPGYDVPNGVRVRELTDYRGDGGYCLAAPSVSTKGEYEWILSPEDSDFSEWPVWITETATLKEDVDKKWLLAKNGVVEGSRNDTAASMAGKIISSTTPELLESIGWEQFKVWNNKNTPPLPERELRSVWESIKKINESNPRDDNPSSQASILLESIINRKDMVLFHDEQKDGYISLEINGHQEIWSCKSKAIKRWLASEVYRTQKKAPGSEVIKSILAVLEGKSRFEGEEVELQNRVAWKNDELYYDLTNKEWQAIKINKKGWEIVEKPPILFKRYSHNKAQIMPSKNGDINLFLNYINVANPEHRLLLLVFLVSCFVPGIPHVMLTIFGAQGSSKSTLSRLARLLVDPSLIEVASFPHGQKELIQALAHHYFLFFDNVSFISEEQSDILCKAITGGGHTKRELYSDDDDVIYNFMRCIGINGINLVATRPDLLERSLLLELERIESSERKTEKELYQNFKRDLPSILGGVFDTLVKALEIQSTIKSNSYHRMADWEVLGCAISEALGYTKEEFLNAYQNNMNRQTEMLLNENIVATVIVTFMEDKNEWKGTPTQLLERLSSDAILSNVDTREKNWPRGANILSRRLNELSTPLKQMGYWVTISTSGTERYIHIQKTAKKEPTQLLLTESTDDTDGIIPTEYISSEKVYS